MAMEVLRLASVRSNVGCSGGEIGAWGTPLVVLHPTSAGLTPDVSQASIPQLF